MLFGDRKIIYYNWPQCYYCQRVTLTFFEKDIPFDGKIIKLLKYENFEPSFINKNVLCTVPVVEDFGNFVNESDRIVDFLENKFQDKTRLYPQKIEKEEWDDVEKYRELVANLPVGQLHFGCQLSPKYSKMCKMDPEFVDKYLSSVNHKVEYLKRLAITHEGEKTEDKIELKDIYENKAKIAEGLNLNTIVENVDKNIEDMKIGLENIDEQIAKMITKGKSWFCSEFFSVADIYLTVLLHKMDMLGLSSILWDDPLNPLANVSAYFKKVMERPSVKKMIPQYKLGVLGTD